jgi:aldose 1-epimerase
MPVAGTPLDLREGAELGWVARQVHPLVMPGHGLDHNYVPDGSGLRRVATLTAPLSGRVLEVSSDLPGLQVYTGNILDGSTVGRSGSVYRRGAGVALETQHFPDAPNQPTFPSAVVRPGTVWQSTTVWDFS